MPPKKRSLEDSLILAPRGSTKARKARKVPSGDSQRLIIALDFGTTYSGVAYAFSALPDTVYIVQEWSGRPGKSIVKAPTWVKYHNKKSFSWGYDIDDMDPHKIEGVKLLLDEDQPRPAYLPESNTKAILNNLGKTAAEVSTDYCREIYRHALKTIEKKYPNGGEFIKNHTKEYVLTVPATWSDKAKDTTLQAAKDAGISPVKLVKEPEAAALFTFQQTKARGLGKGDRFVVCDAGGGTVDLISYEVAATTPLKLKEIVPGEGALAGSQILNRRFERHIINKIGNDAFTALKGGLGYRHSMKIFEESIKREYSGSEEYFVHFPYAKLIDPVSGTESDTMLLTSEELQDIFKPVIGAILELVEAQVTLILRRNKKGKGEGGMGPKALFLVGGFGASPYLRKCIEKSKICQGIQVIQPEEAWSAVVRGAVLSALPREVAVVSSVATRNYGVKMSWPCKKHQHPGEPKTWDALEGTYQYDRMSWYIHKGDELGREHTIQFPSYRNFKDRVTKPEDLIVEEVLYECDVDPAPIYPKKGIIRRNCTLTADLTTVPETAYELNEDPFGSPYYRLDYDLSLTVESASMKFSFGVNNNTYGRVNTEYH